MPHKQENDLRHHDLRQRAKVAIVKLGSTAPDLLELPAPEDASHLLHELRVHQIELELQNEELRRSQQELDASRARYFDLYDLAPVAYCLLSDSGLLLEANFAASELLGLSRERLTMQPLSRFIQRQDQDRYFLHRQELLKTGEPQSFEVEMLRVCSGAERSYEAPFWARLNARITQGSQDETSFRIALTDITASKQAEAELQRLNEELEARIHLGTGELRLALATLEAEVEERRLAMADLDRNQGT